MNAILIGAGVSGVVLGAASRIIFLLPAALMALVVAALLIVRADIDLGFTALAATLLNGGFLLGVALARAMPRLLVSLPWTIDETDAGFMIRNPTANVGHQHLGFGALELERRGHYVGRFLIVVEQRVHPHGADPGG